jgi:hypothetical protein
MPRNLKGPGPFNFAERLRQRGDSLLRGVGLADGKLRDELAVLAEVHLDVEALRSG